MRPGSTLPRHVGLAARGAGPPKVLTAHRHPSPARHTPPGSTRIGAASQRTRQVGPRWLRDCAAVPGAGVESHPGRKSGPAPRAKPPKQPPPFAGQVRSRLPSTSGTSRGPLHRAKPDIGALAPGQPTRTAARTACGPPARFADQPQSARRSESTPEPPGSPSRLLVERRSRSDLRGAGILIIRAEGSTGATSGRRLARDRRRSCPKGSHHDEAG